MTDVSQKHLDRLMSRDGQYRKVIVRALKNELYVELPESIALAIRVAAAKTGISADELIADALRDAFGARIS